MSDDLIEHDKLFRHIEWKGSTLISIEDLRLIYAISIKILKEALETNAGLGLCYCFYRAITIVYDVANLPNGMTPNQLADRLVNVKGLKPAIPFYDEWWFHPLDGHRERIAIVKALMNNPNIQPIDIHPFKPQIHNICQ
jgi:hypothetical protein